MKLLVVVGLIALAPLVGGAVPRLIADVNPLPDTSGVLPAGMVAAGGRVFFAGNDRVHGQELWMTDGTEAGTKLVKDLRVGLMGSQPSMLRAMGTRVFFFADDGEHGVKLWSSDGSETVMVGPPTSPGLIDFTPQQAMVAGGLLYYLDRPSGGVYNFMGLGLWRSDGTVAGTWLLNPVQWTEFGPYRPFGNSKVFTEMDGGLFFSNIDRQLWRSAGTQAETVRLADLGDGAQIVSMAGATGRLWITVNRGSAKELWSWADGAAVLITEIPDGALAPDGLTAHGDRAFFAAFTPEVGGELWTSDGTVTGKAGDVSDRSGPLDPENLTWCGDTFYCTAGNDREGHSLWASDGQTARLVKSWGDAVALASVMANAGTLYFIRNEAGEILWKSDGSEAGTIPVKRITTDETAWGSLSLMASGGRLFFNGNDGQAGFELWSSDGTPDGTGMLFDLKGTMDGHEGVEPGVASWGDNLVFYGNDGISGAEPWISDGTAAGTRMLADVQSGQEGSEPTRFTEAGGKLYFAANDGVHGDELWRSDASGTVMIRDINPGVGSAYLGELTAVGDRLAFTAEDLTGRWLWLTEGNDAVKVKATWGSRMALSGGGVLFSASDPEHGEEPWWTDGVTTRMVKDIKPGSSGSAPFWFTKTGNEAYFLASSAEGSRLWRTDGTGSGTTQVGGWQGPGSIYLLVAAGNRLFFFEEKGTTGLRLWTARDDQAELLKIIGNTGKEYPFAFPADPYVAACGALLFFVANDGEHGDELWRSDGTPTGTVILRDIRPGLMGSAPSNLTAVGGMVYFQANDGISGEELWVTDGTSAGTQLVADIVPGPGGSAPSQLILAGRRLFFGAVTQETGREPHMLEVGEILDFHAWTERAALTAIDAAPTATPHGDGVANLLKYAFGIDGTLPYKCPLAGEPGGLPRFSAASDADGGGNILRVEYVRRTESSLIYTAKRSATLQPDSFMPMTGDERVESIGSGWEKVVRTERVEGNRCFGVVEVTLP